MAAIVLRAPLSLRPLVGIFVGGAARRMGGLAKGLLAAPDGTGSLVARSASLARDLGLEVVLVGEHAAYADLGLPMLADAPPGIGPLGGLLALLEHAGSRSAVALACDLPFVDRATLERVATSPSTAAAIAPRREGRWEPLLCRYDPARVLPVARTRLAGGALALQGLLDAVGADALSLGDADPRVLSDWDTPDDVARSGSGEEKRER
jgi:molybdopterin-guanine dinucleotide biosynthesis protein A